MLHRVFLHHQEASEPTTEKFHRSYTNTMVEVLGGGNPSQKKGVGCHQMGYRRSDLSHHQKRSNSTDLQSYLSTELQRVLNY
jgi:hypothetical protein